MEVRCLSCKKLFRVADDKIIGSGVKFPCTRCGDYVKITREDFEQYALSKTASPALASIHVPSSLKPAPAHPVHAEASAPIPDFDLNSLAAATLGVAPQENAVPPVSAKPAPAVSRSAPKPASDGIMTETKHETAPVQPKHEAKIPAHPKQQPAAVATASADAPSMPVSPSVREGRHPGFPVTDVELRPARSSGAGKKTLVFLLVLLVLAGTAYGVKFYLDNISRQAANATKEAILPDGLQVQSPAGAVDPATGDLVITGVVENTTGKPRPAWFILAEVYDAQGAVLIRGKLLNGKQVYTRRDYEIMAKRGINVEELKQQVLQEQALVIPQKGSISFEMRIFEPPIGVASFNATLQPFDPVQLYNEIAEEQK